MPVHIMLAMALCPTILKLANRIIWDFFWNDRKDARLGNCPVNWQKVCRPRQLGGLGIRDIHRVGIALRTRWLWFSCTDNTRAWAGLALQFTAEERAFFFASTTMQIGNGMEAFFWEDRWIDGRFVGEIAPLLYACIPKRRRKLRTVAHGL